MTNSNYIRNSTVHVLYGHETKTTQHEMVNVFDLDAFKSEL